MANGSILLVEDNLDDVALTLRAFKQNNILNQVVVAHDGPEALELFFDPDADRRRFCLILLDLNLPKISGLEVLSKIRADVYGQIIPTVILTSSQMEEDIVASYNGGANAFVRKPVNFTEFANAIKSLGVFWLLLNEAVNVWN